MTSSFDENMKLKLLLITLLQMISSFFSLSLASTIILDEKIIAQNSDNKSTTIPIVASYNGIGAFYGLAYNNTGNDANLTTGFVNGDIRGIGLSQKWLKTKTRWPITFNAIYLDKILPVTYFSRNSNKDNPLNKIYFHQNAKASLFSLQTSQEQNGFATKYNLSLIGSQIKNYQNSNKVTINTPKIHLAPFAQLVFDVSFSKKVNLFSSSYTKPALNFVVKSPSGGYSGDTNITFSNNWKIISRQKLKLSLNYFYSKIVAVYGPQHSKQKVRKIFSINCNNIVNLNEKTQCIALENSLVDYIYDHDINGTARSLGGTTYLKAYTQSRFRGSKSNYLGFDAEYTFSDNKIIPKIFISLETGAASDDVLNPFDFNRNSYGIGTSWQINKKSDILLFYATGDDGNTVSLTVKVASF